MGGRVRWEIALGFAAALGCRAAGVFTCQGDGDCTSASGGVCQPDGFCSFPDPECASGLRYDDNASGDLSRTCVPSDGADSTGGTATSSGTSAGTSVGSTSGTTSETGIGETEACPSPPCTPGEFVWQLPFPEAFVQTPYLLAGGDILVVGDFPGDLVLPGFTFSSNGGVDAFLARVAGDGALLDAVHYGGPAEEFPLYLAGSPNGRSSIVGVYSGGTANLGGTDLAVPVSFDGFIATYDPDFTHVASRQLRSNTSVGTGQNSANGSATVFTTGTFSQSLTVDGTTINAVGGTDAYYLRMQNDGTVGTFVGVGGTGNETGGAAVADGLGNVFVLGSFTGTLDLGAGPVTSNGGTDVFVAKMNQQGIVDWLIGFGGLGDDRGQVGATGDGGALFLAGAFTGPMSIAGGPMLTGPGDTDIFVARIDPDGNHDWSTAVGGSGGQDQPRSVWATTAGEVAVTGEFTGTATFGGATVTSQFLDGFVLRLDNAGNEVWSRAFGSPDDDRGLSVAIADDGTVYLCAAHLGPLDMGGGELPTTGSWSSVLVRYSGG